METDLKPTAEEIQGQAQVIKDIQLLALSLDADVLRQVIKDWKKKHSFKESAMILDPNPHTALERLERDRLMLERLNIYVKIAENTKALIEAEKSLIASNKSKDLLERMFR